MIVSCDIIRTGSAGRLFGVFVQPDADAPREHVTEKCYDTREAAMEVALQVCEHARREGARVTYVHGPRLAALAPK